MRETAAKVRKIFGTMGHRINLFCNFVAMKAYFDFKQFRIYHDRCGQKVATDGVLLGAWGRVEGARTILDIGSGSGLIALMAAQRVPEACVTGVDVEPEAVSQARENVKESPFAERVIIEQCDIRTYQHEPFDAILCNPPFYTEDTTPPDGARYLARNAQALPFDELITAVVRLLSPQGHFSVMLPTSEYLGFTAQCMAQGLRLERVCHIQTVLRKPPMRSLITYSFLPTEEVQQETLILQEGNTKTEAYQQLARDFYL